MNTALASAASMHYASLKGLNNINISFVVAIDSFEYGSVLRKKLFEINIAGVSLNEHTQKGE